MENKEREVVLLSTLDEINIHAAHRLAYEGGLWSDDDVMLYEEVDDEVTYTDLEKCYQRVTKTFMRVSDGKYFQWSYNNNHYLCRNISWFTDIFTMEQQFYH